MSVGYILQQAGLKMGLDKAIVDQRATLLRFLNEAAEELYDQSDMPNSLWEMVFKVNGNQTITLPAYVGELRAVREFFSQIPWHINTMRPRFNVANWPDMWRNWRIVGNSCLQATVRNTAKGTLVVKAVEDPPIVVTLNGSTEDATAVSESVTMDAVEKSMTYNYINYHGIIKDRVNLYDITVLDADGMQLSQLANNELEADYLVVDVSTFPFLNQDVSQQAHYLEVLYKKALPWYSDDGQEFIAHGYDNILVNKMIQLWAEEAQKPELAVLYDAKATRSTTRKLNNRNRAAEECVSFVPNGHDSLLCTLRGRRRRTWGYGYGYGYGY